MTIVARFLAFLAMATLVLSVARAVRADPQSDAKDLFTRGRELRAQGDCNGAADLFRRAVALYPQGLGSVRNLAECEEALGHWASARRGWIDLKRALIVEKDPKYAGWDDDAEKGAARLAGKVAKLTIVVTVRGANGAGDPGRASGVTVTVNGEAIAPALVGTELERDPGSYRVKAESPDAVAPVEQDVALGTGDAKQVALALSLRPPPPATGPPVPAVTTRSGETLLPPPSSTARVLGWTAIGVGSASLVAAVVSLVVRQSALSDLQSACPNYASAPCDPSVKSTDDRGKLASTLFTVFGAVGIVAVGGGVTLLLTAPSGASAPTSAGVAAKWSF